MVFSSKKNSGNKTRTILFRWNVSIFKLVLSELCIFLTIFGCLSASYRYILDSEQRHYFERLCKYFEKYGTLIPVSFVLGFYVSLVIGRWWAQYKLLPWPDAVATWINDFVRGDSEDDRMIRRTICRYVCLSTTLCYTKISVRTKKRFPTLDHFVVSGLMTEEEKELFGGICHSISDQENYWIPLVWASSIITKARVDGKMFSDTCLKMLLDEINKIRMNLNLLLCFDRVSVPIVYTQVATFATYSYFFSCLFGRQFLSLKDKDDDTRGQEMDLVIPFFTILQFFFYVGWLKVAESLVNPFGDDEYDFDINWMTDRNLKVCYTIVDRMHFHKSLPELTQDIHWHEVVPQELPHTKASFKCRNGPPQNTGSKVTLSAEDGKIVYTLEGKEVKLNGVKRQKQREGDELL